MFCKYCGKIIADDSIFCQFCGGRQGMTATTAAPTAPTSSATDDLADLDSFFSSAVRSKREADAKAKCFEIRDGVLVKYTPPNPPESHVVVPDGVVSIGERVFENAYWLTEITLPNTLQRIEDSAFSGSLLEKIDLPDSVFRIGSFAFHATRLREITFPERITNLPNSVLYGCMFLERVTLPSKLTTIGQEAFCSSSISEIRIPDGVTEIAPGAFQCCKQLTKITLPKGLKSLGARVFSESGIKSLQLPDGITAVPTDLCSECNDLETVTLGQNTVSIGSSAFWYCHSLKTVRCGEKLESIGENRFMSRGSFAVREGTPTETLTLYIPATLREIRDYSFDNRQDSKLFVEFDGSYAQWKAVTKTEHYRYANPANVRCNGVPSVGDTYLFGAYHYFDDETKPIEWIVLSVGVDRMLLLSKYVLDAAVYYHDEAPVTWERSDLRRWLNDTFLHSAFSFEDQRRILSTTVINENNRKFGTKGGNTTSDQIFCLSISEYEDLSYRYKFAESTPYAGARVEYAAERNADGDLIESAYWWLRTPGGFDWDDERGKESVWASFACGNDVMSMGVEKRSVGVRPAMWIKSK